MDKVLKQKYGGKELKQNEMTRLGFKPKTGCKMFPLLLLLLLLSSSVNRIE